MKPNRFNILNKITMQVVEGEKFFISNKGILKREVNIVGGCKGLIEVEGVKPLFYTGLMCGKDKEELMEGDIIVTKGKDVIMVVFDEDKNKFRGICILRSELEEVELSLGIEDLKTKISDLLSRKCNIDLISRKGDLVREDDSYSKENNVVLEDTKKIGNIFQTWEF